MLELYYFGNNEKNLKRIGFLYKIHENGYTDENFKFWPYCRRLRK